MRETPCASCGDREQAVGLQADRLVLCDRCTRVIPEWFFVATDEELHAFFGFAVPIATRHEALSSAASKQTHTDLAVAYAQKALTADAAIEWALAAMNVSEPHAAVGRLIEPVAQRGMLGALARSVGLHLHRRSTVS